MPSQPDAVLLTIIFNFCTDLCTERAIQLADQLLRQTPDRYKSHVILSGSMIKMLMKFGRVKEAEDLFQSLKNRDLITYGLMMKGTRTL